MDKGMKERDKLIIENGVLIFRMEDRRQVWLVIVSPQIDVWSPTVSYYFRFSTSRVNFIIDFWGWLF